MVLETKENNSSPMEDASESLTRSCPGCDGVATRPPAQDGFFRGGDDEGGERTRGVASDVVYCSFCVRTYLQRVKERHSMALENWKLARQGCLDHFRQQEGLLSDQSPSSMVPRSYGPDHVAELQDQSERLRNDVEQIRGQCTETAVRLYKLQLKVQERQDVLREKFGFVSHRRETLQRLYNSLCSNSISSSTNDNSNSTTADGNEEIPPHTTTNTITSGALVQAVGNARTTVRTLRFQWALQAFHMHRLQVEEGYADQPVRRHQRQSYGEADGTTSTTTTGNTNGRTFVSGIGKIGGLPLPHAGPELYGVLPAEELQSALRLVAQLTSLTARCLGIRLPHPIQLQPPPPPPTTTTMQPPTTTPTRTGQTLAARTANIDVAGGDIADLAYTARDSDRGRLDAAPNNNRNAASSLASSLSAALHGQPASLLSDIPGFSGSNTPSTALSSLSGVSMDPHKVDQRVRHAVAAVIAEDQSRNCTTYYTLSAENIHQDEFAIAQQLLQNNVIALCIRAGVPVAKLWPGEALLLNLHALHMYCESQVQLSYEDMS